MVSLPLFWPLPGEVRVGGRYPGRSKDLRRRGKASKWEETEGGEELRVKGGAKGKGQGSLVDLFPQSLPGS